MKCLSGAWSALGERGRLWWRERDRWGPELQEQAICPVFESYASRAVTEWQRESIICLLGSCFISLSKSAPDSISLKAIKPTISRSRLAANHLP